MLSYDEAIRAVLGSIETLPVVEAPLLSVLGLTLAGDISMPYPSPPFDNSAMDGFAVRSIDVACAASSAPVRLPVVDSVMAGDGARPPLPSGAAARIMTGAPVPDGADAVIPIEDTEQHEGSILVIEQVKHGAFIRRKGEEIAADAIVLTRGLTLTPSAIGMAAGAGRSSLSVHRRPAVCILVTGDELVEPGEPLSYGQIYNSNAYSIAALVVDAGCIVQEIIRAGDTREGLREALDRCITADVIISTGGVSVGDRDFVKEVVAERGAIDLWRAAIRPGKPFAFGRAGSSIFFGLPGNPVSAMVTFELFVRPALKRMMGQADVMPMRRNALLTEDISHDPGRRSFFRGILAEADGDRTVRLTGPQGSGMLSSLVAANCLVIVPEDVSSIPAGDVVTVIPLRPNIQ